MTHKVHYRGTAALALTAVLLGTACSKEATPTDGKAPAAPAVAKATNGRVIVVEAYSDASGNYFKPNEIEAKPGDILRFTLKSGVHNVHFLPDSNTGKTDLPPASDMLQLPDQTYDVNVTFAKGKYYFQCDPHAALGMKGHLEVED
jgi:Plastocyanin